MITTDNYHGFVVLAIWSVVIVGTVLGVVAFLWWSAKPTGMMDVPMMSFVSGTEYNIGEAGQVIVEARFANGTSALSASCLMSIWYPDKSLFLLGNGTTGVNGNQYVQFTVPNMTGVYEYQAICPMVTGRNGTVSKSFHVSEFQNLTTERLNRIKARITK